MINASNANDLPNVEKANYKVNVSDCEQITIANPEHNFELFSSQIKDLYNKVPKHIGIYAGSFNPIHEGHIDIILKASRIFDLVFVVIADNPDKHYSVSRQDRQELISRELGKLIDLKGKFQVGYTQGLIAEYALQVSKGVFTGYKASVTLIRGIRSASDLEYEKPIAEFNKQLHSNTIIKKVEPLETIYITADPNFEHISSSSIRQLARLTTNHPRQFINLFQSMSSDWIESVKEWYHNEP